MTALARIVVRLRFLVVALWVVVAAFALPRSARVSDSLQAEGGSLTPTEAEAVKRTMLENFQRPTVSFMAVVISGPVPIDSQPYHTLVEVLSSAAESQPYIDHVVSYLTVADSRLISADRHTTFFLAALTGDVASSPGHLTPEFRQVIRRAVLSVRDSEGYEVHVTGAPALDYDGRLVVAEDARRNELIALIPAAGVLVLAFGALFAALLPIIIGVFAISCALAAVQIAAVFFPMSVFVLTIVTMVGLAVGIDYSLLIVTRFREEMNRGQSPKEAATKTILTAGRAVVTSGL
ncbi:MAG: MMPL family transporter, partial [Gemmatimonadetes bacterium]|nr:MMPL family transporter [Gemmatimonadota bacterium]